MVGYASGCADYPWGRGIHRGCKLFYLIRQPSSATTLQREYGTGANVSNCPVQVAGSNLIVGAEQYIAESKLQMLSPTGRSRMWDADADGYARGEGVAAIVLKKLSQAMADGDHIECVIRETGANQDGRTPGITMPSASSQEALIRATYEKAGLDISKRSDRPQYFEAHGTGMWSKAPIPPSTLADFFQARLLAIRLKRRPSAMLSLGRALTSSRQILTIPCSSGRSRQS